VIGSARARRATAAIRTSASSASAASQRGDSLPCSLVISLGGGSSSTGAIYASVACRSFGIQFAGAFEAVAFLLRLMCQRRQPNPSQFIGGIQLQSFSQQLARRLRAAGLVGDDGPPCQVG
jgi:hypothetical protein